MMVLLESPARAQCDNDTTADGSPALTRDPFRCKRLVKPASEKMLLLFVRLSLSVMAAFIPGPPFFQVSSPRLKVLVCWGLVVLLRCLEQTMPQTQP